MKDVFEYIKENLSTRQAHLNLKEDCIERGGNSTRFQGLLAAFLNTTIPNGNRIHLCHACHNDKCSNPKHLYYGTPKENFEDMKKAGKFNNAWQRMVDKYGQQEALNKIKQNFDKGRTKEVHAKSVETKRKKKQASLA